AGAIGGCARSGATRLSCSTDQFGEQRAVAARRIDARRGAEQGDALARRHLLRQAEDAVALRLHLAQVAAAVLVPVDRRAVLAVDGGVQRDRRRQLFDPGVPALVLPADAARAVAGDEDARAVVGFDRIVPAARLDLGGVHGITEYEEYMDRKHPVEKSDDEWRKLLTEEQFRVLRQKGTERAFTGAYWNSHDRALYVCAACGQELFKSEAKFDSGCGWPSFTAPADAAAVENERDDSHGMSRTEVMCSRCGGHLGHVFDDGPRPTGLRYCINSAAL